MLALANLGLWVNGVWVGPDGARQKESDAGKAPKYIAMIWFLSRRQGKGCLQKPTVLKHADRPQPGFQSPKHAGTTQEDSPPTMNPTPL